MNAIRSYNEELCLKKQNKYRALPNCCCEEKFHKIKKGTEMLHFKGLKLTHKIVTFTLYNFINCFLSRYFIFYPRHYHHLTPTPSLSLFLIHNRHHHTLKRERITHNSMCGLECIYFIYIFIFSLSLFSFFFFFFLYLSQSSLYI